MEIKTILPWQQGVWDSLLERKQQERLPHAWLFLGADGLGKKQFAETLAFSLLCHSPLPEGFACGQCRGCRLLQAGSHPDIKLIEPEETGQMIKIDQVREIVGFVNETALMSGYRIIMIDPASAMNINAANALLKTLEEPTPKTLIILICNQSMRLPATIISRCQRIIFPKPSQTVALKWLETSCKEISVKPAELTLLLSMAEGAPLRAKDFLSNGMLSVRQELYQGLLQLSQQQSDPLQFAVRWQEQELQIIFMLLLSWLRDALCAKVTANSANLTNSDYQAAMEKLIQLFSAEKLLEYIDTVQQTYARFLNSLNVNKQLLLEEIFIRWIKLCS
ncbi:MAG: DNA polymerase III subunit delta' [Gammaproteobacteria bacterium]